MLRIREAGFHIAARKETELPRDIAEQFYGDHKEKEYFEDLVEHMTRYVHTRVGNRWQFHDRYLVAAN